MIKHFSCGGSVVRVLGFVSSERGFKCRLISQRDYEGQLQDARLSNQCLDFGVYGDHLLFRTTSYEPTNEGVFSIDPTMIQNYRRVHESCDGRGTVARSPLQPA